jgi:hypothetical protein
MKRVSLATLSVNAPPAPQPAAVRQVRGRKGRRPVRSVSSDNANKITGEAAVDGGNRVQVAFRMEKDAYKDLKRMALDEDTTVNELMVRAINELRERKGLKKLSS